MNAPPPFTLALPATGELHVACLCAAWCRLCESYADLFHRVMGELQVQHPGLRAHWIDIEDEAELVGDFDVETFPTLVVVEEAGVRFAGPLTPQAETLRRVLRAALAGPARSGAHEGEVLAFAQRLCQRAPQA